MSKFVVKYLSSRRSTTPRFYELSVQSAEEAAAFVKARVTATGYVVSVYEGVPDDDWIHGSSAPGVVS